MSVQPNPKLGIDPESGAFSLDNLVTQLEAAQKARQNALGMVEQAEADILKARAVRGLTNALLGNSRTRDESAYLLSMLYRHDEEIDPNEFNIAPIVRRLEIAEKILGYKSDSGEKRFSLEQAADIANKVTSVARVDIQSVTGIVDFYLEVLKKVKLDDGIALGDKPESISQFGDVVRAIIKEASDTIGKGKPDENLSLSRLILFGEKEFPDMRIGQSLKDIACSTSSAYQAAAATLRYNRTRDEAREVLKSFYGLTGKVNAPQALYTIFDAIEGTRIPVLKAAQLIQYLSMRSDHYETDFFDIMKAFDKSVRYILSSQGVQVSEFILRIEEGRSKALKYITDERTRLKKEIAEIEGDSHIPVLVRKGLDGKQRLDELKRQLSSNEKPTYDAVKLADYVIQSFSPKPAAK